MEQVANIPALLQEVAKLVKTEKLKEVYEYYLSFTGFMCSKVEISLS